TLFPGENPIGRRLAVEHSTETGWDWLEIVGVVRPIKTNNLLSDSDIGGQIFLNAYRSLPWWAGLVIKTENQSDAAAMDALNDLLASRDPYLAIAYPETMDAIIKRRYSDER